MKFALAAYSCEDDMEEYIDKIGDNLKIESVIEVFDELYPIESIYYIITLYSIGDLLELQRLISGEDKLISVKLDDTMTFVRKYGALPTLVIGEEEY